MRFDELPAELVVMLSKRCDPFTRDHLRLTSKSIKAVIDLHFKWKPCLEFLSLELAPDGDEVSRIRVSTCTVYGKEEVQIRHFRTSEERAAILADCLAKVSSVRRLHLLGIPINNVLLPVLVNEFQKIGYLNDLDLEECAIGLGKTEMSQLVNNMNLKSIRIIRCQGAYRIVDDKVTIEQVDREIQEAFEVINEIEANRPQNPRVRFYRNPQLRELHGEVRRLQALRMQLELRDRVEEPMLAADPVILPPRQNGPVPQMFGANRLNAREALQRLQEVREEDANEDRDERPFLDANRQRQRFERRNLGRVLLAAGMAQPVRPQLAHHAPQQNEVPDQRYIFITKRVLDFLKEHRLPRFELRNLTANNNITLTSVVDLIKELSNLPNIVWTPEPTWLHGFIDCAQVFKKFEMKTTDGKKTFLFSTNVK